MSKKRKTKDPFASREAGKYEHPIPSREFIINHLQEHGRPLGFEKLASALELTHDNDLYALQMRLRAMLRDAQLMLDRRKRYCLINKLDLIEGLVIAHPDGFGFIRSEKHEDDFYVYPKEMRAVLHGDRVLVREIGQDKRGRTEVSIIEVLERNTHQVVGRYFEEKGMFFVEPDNKRLPQTVLIPSDKTHDAKSGQIVMAKLIAQPDKRTQPIGEIVEVLGDHMAPGMEIDIAIRSHELPNIWPQAVLDESGAFSPEVTKADIKGRKDIRDLPLLTIDGADAKDFDDAVYCEPIEKGGWKLLVAIADVSHYVKVDSALDREGKQRGNSVYFPGRVIPMLPEVLSNGLCSLRPEVDRLCMVCEMSIDKDGKLTRHRFYEAVMYSHARLTYSEVAAMLVDDDQKLQKKYQSVFPHLQSLHALFKTLHKARAKRGAIELDIPDTRIVFGEDQKIEKIVEVVRNDAHRLIEECMLMANIATAQFLLQNEMPCLYRIHATPGESKIADLREFLSEIGLSLHGGKQPHGKDYTKLLASIQERPDKHIIQLVLLMSLSQAVYSPDNIGHFALAYPHYAHFTSPIRRYPDLLVHRAIKHVLNRGDASSFNYSHGEMEKLGTHLSKTERRADDATRDAVAWLKCEFMLDKVGEEFTGVISGVTNFGLFIELQEVYVEGLLHITGLKSDYYHYDSARHRLTGERTHKTYKLGDTIMVRIVRVDLDTKKIDFELAE